MRFHDLKIALRKLRRRPLFVGINVVGLSIGATCCLLLILYVDHALSYDTYHEDTDQVYRLLDYGGFADDKRWGSYVDGDPTDAVSSFSGVEALTKFKSKCGTDRIRLSESVYRNVKMYCAQPELFDVFSFELTRGSEEALARPDGAIITRSLAERLFGDSDPMGKRLPIQFFKEVRTFRVGGVMKDVPSNTHFTFDLLLAYEALRSTPICRDCGQPMYARLTPKGDPEQVATQVLRHIRQVDGATHVEDVRLEPITDVYFSDVAAPRQGERSQVYILGGIALLILLIGCANYMNLATARFAQQAHEVGVRKALGARRGELTARFLAETLLITACALALAVPLVVAGLPLVNTLGQTNLQLTWATGGALAVAIATLLLLISVLAGSYPAVFFTSARPARVLRGHLPSGLGAVGLRKALVTFQFVVATALIALTVLMAQQLQFIQTKDLGFQEDQIVLLYVADPQLRQQPERLRSEFRRLASVRAVTVGAGMPGLEGFHSATYNHRPRGESGRSVSFHMTNIGPGFLETFEIPLLAGRNIDPGVDTTGLEGLINETAMEAMGWANPADAIGRKIEFTTIVGVVPDFHYESLQVPIQPLLMKQSNTAGLSRVALRVTGRDLEGALSGIRQTWKQFGSTQPLEMTFLSDHLRGLYEQQRRSTRLFGLFGGLAIAVACLGLFGLTTYAAERRTPEIGIRKTLGASMGSVVWLLVCDTGQLALLGLVFATPFAYWAGQRWLTGFAYRIDIGLVPLLVAGVLTLAVTFLASGTQAFRAARIDPATALRHE
jgi:putative ABC transport system permease protein